MPIRAKEAGHIAIMDAFNNLANLLDSVQSADSAQRGLVLSTEQVLYSMSLARLLSSSTQRYSCPPRVQGLCVRHCTDDDEQKQLAVCRMGVAQSALGIHFSLVCGER